MFPNIDAEIARNGMTRAELARKLGISYTTMKNWMHGKTDIPCSQIIKLAKMFNVSTDYLLGMSNTM